MMEAFEVDWANRFASTSIFMTLHGETRETAALLIIVLFLFRFTTRESRILHFCIENVCVCGLFILYTVNICTQIFSNTVLFNKQILILANHLCCFRRFNSQKQIKSASAATSSGAGG